MKRQSETNTASYPWVVSLVLVAGLALPLRAYAGSVALATEPLANTTTSTVKPNVMFILDDSGSMNSDYLPDWAHDDFPNSDPKYSNYRYDDLPELLRNSGFNGVAYDPATVYAPPVFYNADGTLNTTTYPNIGSPWTSVKNDAFNSFSSTTNLTTSFDDIEWCTNTNYDNCVRNDNLILPGTIDGVSYTRKHSKNSTGTGYVASGTPDAPTKVARTFGPFFYTIVPGEYCDSPNLKNCQYTKTDTFKYPATLRWCNSSALTNCQALNSSTYKYPRYPTTFFQPGTPGSPGVPAVPPSPATSATTPSNGTLVITGVDKNKTIWFKCGSTYFGKQSTFSSSGSNSSGTRLDDLYDDINGTTVHGYTTTCSKSTSWSYFSGYHTSSLTCSVAAPVGPSACSGGFTVDNNVDVSTNTGPQGGADAQPAQPGSPEIPAVPAQPAVYYGKFIRTDIVPEINSYPYPGKSVKADTRTDCAGTTCTYAEEMTNFANWWTYYHTRMQAMKTSVSRAFKSLDNRYRVGFTTISDKGATDGSKFLGNNTFELTHKNSWFTKLFATTTSGSTPLRGALSKAGRYYANKLSSQVDPVQYSCQQNFTILSTDGYWNTGNEDSNYTNNGLSGLIPDMDGSGTPRPQYEGPTASSGSLADIAKYYYDTDLRTAGLGNCSGGTSPDYTSGNPDVCTNNVFVSSTDKNTKQHMTTFTMGLGAEGVLNYTPDYLTDTVGDYYDLKNALNGVNWPDPQVSSSSNTVVARIDDLWHAAVNGGGVYFSAKNPDQIVTGFNKALSSISVRLGSAAAAATSTLNPVAGNNFAYVASYTTVKWIGNLEARTINTATGAVSESASWCVENVIADTCAAPGNVVADTSDSTTVYRCVVSGATEASCPAPGVFDSGTSECRTEIANACTGTLGAKVSATSDTRTIYTAPAGSLTPLTKQNLVPFDAAYAAANPSNFSTSHINGLNQWGTLDSSQQTAAAGANLINYLRGQNGYEDRASNDPANRLYRAREAVLGDALESQPAFISKPVFNYPYAGYSAFKTAQASRSGTVYMGTNDGMMHAFASSNGAERWAYVPSMVIPNLWKLASTSYSTNHANFVNGSPITTDFYCTVDCGGEVGGAASWRTMLVAGLNGGGRGYYALDITDPDKPILLWEFTTTAGSGTVKDDDVGYGFTRPVVTRKADGTWVVLVTSGYNNISPGDGKGYLFVLDATKGTVLSKISTTVGSTTTPSGLGKIAAWNDEPGGNRAGYVYGGDLLGNLWRFDVNTGSVLKFATLFSDAAGTSPQPITTTPVLGLVEHKRVVFVGTGKYLEAGDLTTTQKQTEYAIKDDEETATLVNPRTTLVNQTLTDNPDGTGTRVVNSPNAVDFSSDRGWYVDFPDGGSGGAGAERANIDGRLVQGTLLVPTIVPSSTVCAPGGYGWLNYFDYKTGASVDTTGVASSKYDSTIVGINVIYIAGEPKVEVVTSTNPTPELDETAKFPPAGSGFTGKRATWRELIQ